MVIVIRQIILARSSVDADHLRRKKEFTFNGYNLIREDIRDLNRSILQCLDLKVEEHLIDEHLHEINVPRRNVGAGI